METWLRQLDHRTSGSPPSSTRRRWTLPPKGSFVTVSHSTESPRQGIEPARSLSTELEVERRVTRERRGDATRSPETGEGARPCIRWCVRANRGANENLNVDANKPPQQHKTTGEFNTRTRSQGGVQPYSVGGCMSRKNYRFVRDTRFCPDVGAAARPWHAGGSWFDRARSALSNQLSATSWLSHHEPGEVQNHQ